MSNLLSPITIKSLSFRNRIVTSPMCQYSSTDGFYLSSYLMLARPYCTTNKKWTLKHPSNNKSKLEQ
jgi:2,4-dienoyl-CoA reductase-like NADH-dependent reductase (Old Yellow Enzyme family)